MSPLDGAQKTHPHVNTYPHQQRFLSILSKQNVLQGIDITKHLDLWKPYLVFGEFDSEKRLTELWCSFNLLNCPDHSSCPSPFPTRAFVSEATASPNARSCSPRPLVVRSLSLKVSFGCSLLEKCPQRSRYGHVTPVCSSWPWPPLFHSPVPPFPLPSLLPTHILPFLLLFSYTPLPSIPTSPSPLPPFSFHPPPGPGCLQGVV